MVSFGCLFYFGVSKGIVVFWKIEYLNLLMVVIGLIFGFCFLGDKGFLVVEIFDFKRESYIFCYLR